MAETKKSCQVLRKDLLETGKLINALQRSGNAMRQYGIKLFPVIDPGEASSRKLMINQKLMSIESFIESVDESTKLKERKVVECLNIMDKKWTSSFAVEMKKIGSQKALLDKEWRDATQKFSRL